MAEPLHEDAAWAEVLARWDDEDAHRAYLAAASEAAGLDGLAEAGRRYKQALDRSPADAVALRWRDEVVRRATALALAQLPRTAPPRAAASPGLRRALLALLALATVAAAAWIALRAPALLRGAP